MPGFCQGGLRPRAAFDAPLILLQRRSASACPARRPLGKSSYNKCTSDRNLFEPSARAPASPGPNILRNHDRFSPWSLARSDLRHLSLSAIQAHQALDRIDGSSPPQLDSVANPLQALDYEEDMGREGLRKSGSRATQQSSHARDGSSSRLRRRRNQPADGYLKPRKGRPATQSFREYLSERHDRDRHNSISNVQWGFLRHQVSQSERAAAKKIFTNWKKNYLAVIAGKDCSSQPWYSSGQWLLELPSTAEMRQAWESLTELERQEQWSRLMLATLARYPEKIYMVLDATLEPLPPGYAIADALWLMALHLKVVKLRGRRERAEVAGNHVDLVVRILQDLPREHMPFLQRTFGVLAGQLDAEHVHELYTVLQQTSRQLHKNTLLQFARVLAKDPARKGLVFDILKSLIEQGVDPNKPEVASIITSLLFYRARHDGWSGAGPAFNPKDALHYFMEQGFAPNVISLTALIDALGQNGEVDEAVRLTLLFAESGVQLDTKVCSTVFRAAKGSLRTENIVKALDVARASQAPYIDVLNNLLHSIFYFAEMEGRKRRLPLPWTIPLFLPMLRVYARRFDLHALQPWIPESLPLLMSEDSQPSEVREDGARRRTWAFKEGVTVLIDDFFAQGDADKLQPNSTTIAIMLRAYIRSLEQPYSILSFYNFFKARLAELASNAPPGTTPDLLKDQGSLIHDTIILTLTEKRNMSRSALHVFGEMLRDFLASAPGQEPHQEQQQVPFHPPPSVFTFTIILRGLMAQGQHALAEQVLHVMREQGVEPNLVTWNTLIKGYAMAQNISQTVETLQELEAAGWKPDLNTFDAFGRLHDQNRALKMMERIIDTNKRRMMKEEHLFVP